MIGISEHSAYVLAYDAKNTQTDCSSPTKKALHRLGHVWDLWKRFPLMQTKTKQNPDTITFDNHPRIIPTSSLPFYSNHIGCFTFSIPGTLSPIGDQTTLQ